jgi:allantoinase
MDWLIMAAARALAAGDPLGALNRVAEAEIALVSRESWTMRARESPSAPSYTPFEGIELSARVKATFLRGALVCENGKLPGPPRGRYLHRPT